MFVMAVTVTYLLHWRCRVCLLFVLLRLWEFVVWGKEVVYVEYVRKLDWEDFFMRVFGGISLSKVVSKDPWGL